MDGGFAIPLSTDFRFIHEPLDCTSEIHLRRFVGRRDELDELATRVILSDGGAFLVTGYRGVGKSTFVNRVIHQIESRLPDLASVVGPLKLVDVHLNIPRAMEPVELMYHVLRGLYLRLAAKELLPVLDARLRDDLELAFQRTSQSIALRAASGFESTSGAKLGIPIPWIKDATASASFGTKRTESQSRDIKYLAYDDKAAEYDLIQIARRLSRDFVSRRPWWRRAQDVLTGRRPPQLRLKVVLVFDELDKIDDTAGSGESSIDAILSNLKTLFTTSGISFLFVAGKNIHERWVEDVGRGDSIYESVFSYARYLPPLWAHASPMCDAFLAPGAFDSVDVSQQASAYDAFKKFLSFNGRGIPRRVLRKFNERVRLKDMKPVLTFSRDDIRQFRFFADLADVLTNHETVLIGDLLDDESSGWADRKRLGIYYLVDWILLRGIDAFSLQDAVAASRRLSSMIAPVEEAAPEMIGRLLSLLVTQAYLEIVEPPPSAAEVQKTPPSRYRLTRKRLVEMGSLAGVVDQEAQVVVDDERKKLFGGRYQVSSVLGRGGMSTVYLAEDRQTSKRVAVKEQLAQATNNADDRERFRHEAEVLAKLQHPNIVRYLDAGFDHDRCYIVMEYVEGVRLADLMKGNVLPENDVLRVARDLVAALNYIHEQRVLWGDPKPTNVMITPQGRVVLLDFGISKLLESEPHQRNLLVGTPSYMSPEQLRRERIDERSELYSLGVLLYELATGRLPFEGGAQDLPTLLTRVTASPPAPHTIRDVSPEFERAIMKCLEPDRANRFPSARALLEAFPEPPPGALLQPVGLSAVTTEREDEETASFAGDVVRPDTLAPLPTQPGTGESIGARLVAADGSVFELRTPRVRVGRGPQNDVVLHEPRASRYHAELQFAKNNWLIADLNTRNGTTVNGISATAPVLLRNGDKISIGATTLVFQHGANDGSVSSRARYSELERFMEQLRNQSALASVTELLDSVLDWAIDLARGERGFVMLANDNDMLEFKAARARGRVSLPGTVFRTSRKIPEECYRTGNERIVIDLLDELPTPDHSITVALGIRNVLCIPLRPRSSSKPIGVLYLDSRERGIVSEPVRAALHILAVEVCGVISETLQHSSVDSIGNLESDLIRASEIQRALMDQGDRVGPFFSVSAKMVPSALVGGDFFQYLSIESKKIAIAIGDVSGKGLAAASLAKQAVQLLRANAAPTSKPSTVLGAVNNAIIGHTAESRFVTMFYAVLHEDGTLECASAGFSPAVLIRGGEISHVSPSGAPLNLFEHVPLDELVIPMHHGDMLVLVTDGLAEAVDEMGREFGIERLQSEIRRHATEEPRVVIDALFQALESFQRTDDATAVVLKYVKPAVA